MHFGRSACRSFEDTDLAEELICFDFMETEEGD